jgi:hypothetical protein
VLPDNRLFRPPSDVAFNGGLDCIEQALVAKRLRKKIDRAGLDRLDRHWNVGVSGDKYDWLRFAAGVQMPLEIEATQARQAHVQHQASRLFVSLRLKQLLRRAKAGGIQTHRLH